MSNQEHLIRVSLHHVRYECIALSLGCDGLTTNSALPATHVSSAASCHGGRSHPLRDSKDSRVDAQSIYIYFLRRCDKELSRRCLGSPPQLLSPCLLLLLLF